ARLEVGIDDIAQRMALRADHAARFRIEARGADDERVGDGRSSLRSSVRLDVRAAGAVAPLARCAEISPLRRIVGGCRTIVVFLPADMTTDAVLVPLLYRPLVGLLGPDDVHVVEPFLP